MLYSVQLDPRTGPSFLARGDHVPGLGALILMAIAPVPLGVRVAPHGDRAGTHGSVALHVGRDLLPVGTDLDARHLAGACRGASSRRPVFAGLLLYICGYGSLLCAITVDSYIKEWRRADALLDQDREDRTCRLMIETPSHDAEEDEIVSDARRERRSSRRRCSPSPSWSSSSWCESCCFDDQRRPLALVVEDALIRPRCCAATSIVRASTSSSPATRSRRSRRSPRSTPSWLCSTFPPRHLGSGVRARSPRALPGVLPRDQFGARRRRLPAGRCRPAEADHGLPICMHRGEGSTMRATPLDRAENRWYQVFDNPSPLLKQAPTVIATVVAAILTWWVPDLPLPGLAPACDRGRHRPRRHGVVAAVLTVRGLYEGWAVLLIPIVDIAGLGLFRTGTGGPASLFSSLVLLPVVWLAAAPRHPVGVRRRRADLRRPADAVLHRSAGRRPPPSGCAGWWSPGVLRGGPPSSTSSRGSSACASSRRRNSWPSAPGRCQRTSR